MSETDNSTQLDKRAKQVASIDSGIFAAQEPSTMALRADPAVIDLYRMAVEMADRASAKRAASYGFYITVQTALLAFADESQRMINYPP